MSYSIATKRTSEGIYPHINLKEIHCMLFELEISRRLYGRGGDAKTIISPNTSFGDIIIWSSCRPRLCIHLKPLCHILAC